MDKHYAKFTAEIQKGINIKGSDVEMKLLIPLKAAQPYLNFLSNSQGNEVNIFVGDPQMAFDFEEDADDAYRLYQRGHRVTADASGVVISVEETKDENQAELPIDDPEQADVPEETQEQPGESKEEAQPAEPGQGELDDYEKEVMGDGTAEQGSDLPEWMKAQQKSLGEDKVMSFEVGEREQSEPAAEDKEGDQEVTVHDEISPEALEEYILSQRPSFPDLPLDFPGMFERKRNDGVTWREIARDVGMTSGQLSTKVSKYKEEVRKKMNDGGAA
ncbi:hypothetical protein JJQ72_02150 [Paenibacillus sp. F411]|uniref:hypothetical protein n=1 Tax=Paenibacillus sp. F411 TaxID=2820239 RepID=UPI001AAFEDC1|nr:hypothetical protein [Paenibacillus sp. F411]MBO2942787.1 hypothetical protein [Paenibacillus sp. F411]